MPTSFDSSTLDIWESKRLMLLSKDGSSVVAKISKGRNAVVLEATGRWRRVIHLMDIIITIGADQYWL